MKRLLCLLAALLVAGCSAHTQIRVGTLTTGTPPAGTSISSSAAGLDIRTSNAFGAIVTLATLGALFDLWREPERPLLAPGRHLGATPQMLEGRRVNQQDCARPVEYIAANLRCR